MELTPITLRGEWFYLNVEIYHSKIFLYIGSRAEMAESAEEMLREKFGQGKEAKEMAEFLKSHWEGRWGEMTYDGDSIGYNGVGFIRIAQMVTGKLDDILIFNHECLHIADRILKYVGVKEYDNNEALCYLHEFIFGKLMEQMCERGMGLKQDRGDKGDKAKGEEAKEDEPLF